MKLFVLVIGVCFVQMCLSAPTTDSDEEEESRGISDDDIKRFGDVLNKAGISQKSKDDFMATLKKVRSNASENEAVEVIFDLLSIAVQGDELCEKKLDLKQLMEVSSEESKTESTTGEKSKNTAGSLTESELKEMEEKLAKELTPKQLEHAMKIIRAFRQGATEAEHAEAIVDLIFSAVKSLMMKGCEMPAA